MKITRTKLRQLIKEELRVLLEVKVDPDIDHIRIGGSRHSLLGGREGDPYTLQVYGPGATPKWDGGKGPTGEWESTSGQHIDKAREHILYLLDKHPEARVTMLMSSDYGYNELYWGGRMDMMHTVPKEVYELEKEF